MFKVIFKEKGRKSVYISSKYTISYIYIYILENVGVMLYPN